MRGLNRRCEWEYKFLGFEINIWYWNCFFLFRDGQTERKIDLILKDISSLFHFRGLLERDIQKWLTVFWNQFHESIKKIGPTFQQTSEWRVVKHWRKVFAKKIFKLSKIIWLVGKYFLCQETVFTGKYPEWIFS